MKIEIIKLDDYVKKYNVDLTKEYDMIHLHWFIMDSGLMRLLKYWFDGSKLNDTYCLIIDTNDYVEYIKSDFFELAKQNGYYFESGEILKKGTQLNMGKKEQLIKELTQMHLKLEDLVKELNELSGADIFTKRDLVRSSAADIVDEAYKSKEKNDLITKINQTTILLEYLEEVKKYFKELENEK